MPSPLARPTIRLTVGQSRSSPGPLPYRTDAPNVLLVLLDDVGFAQLGCYGSDIETPAIDGLAARGVRFTNFHTTAMCSSTRACILTGRNHHRVGMGLLPDVPMRFPGYTGRIPPEAGTLPEILRDEGFANYLVGKWHLTPREERTPAGPHDCWPLGKGFDRFYGFLGGETNQYTPDIVQDNTYMEPPQRPEDGYHLNTDLADRAMLLLQELRVHQPERPFFLCYSTGAAHAPHQAPHEWRRHYRGRFDCGWDEWRRRTLARQRSMGIVPPEVELSPRPEWVPAWEALDADRKRVAARMMEVYAAYLSHTDYHLGRLLDHLARTGDLDRTLVVLASDNGCSAEGGPEGSVNELRFIADLPEDPAQNLAMIDELGGWRTYNHYPWGWALAGNTPLRRWKRYTWEGGIRDPLVISWPSGVEPSIHGAVRDQYCHAIDLLPTILDVCRIAAPERLRAVPQMSLDGVSMSHLLTPDGGDAPDVRSTQYYEMWGSRAIYHEGWKAVTDHVNQQHASERDLTQGSNDFHQDQWLLFHVEEDFNEVRDLAAEHPAKLRELVEIWFTEAGRNGVLPLSDGLFDRIAHMDFHWAAPRQRYELPAGTAIHEEAGPLLFNTEFSLLAELREPLHANAEGVLAEQGDWTNGWAWFVREGQVTWMLNFVGESIHPVRAPVPHGVRTFGFALSRTNAGGWSGRLFADGKELSVAEVARPIPFRWKPNGAFLTVGHARGFPVCEEYRPPFHFTGALQRIVVVTSKAAQLRPETFRRVQTHFQ